MTEATIKKNKIIFFPGILISVLGSTLFSFATGLYLLEKTGAGSSYAINIMLSVVPVVLLSPIFGMLIDRVSKKFLIILGDILNGVLMLAIYFLWDRVNNIGLVYAGSLLSSVFTILVFLTFEAGKPQLFSNAWLRQSNAVSSSVNSACRIIGPILGGLVYAFTDIKVFILINAVSFFVSMLFELFLEFDKGEVGQKKSNLKDGITFIKSNQGALKIMFIGVAINIVFPLVVPVAIPYIINTYFRLGSKAFGIIQGFFPFGMIIGSYLVNKMKAEFTDKYVRRIFIMIGIVSVIFLIPFFKNMSGNMVIIIYSVLMFLMGILVAFFDIPLVTYLQRVTPDNLRGQVMGVFISIAKLVAPVMLLISGKLLDLYSPKATILIGALTSIGIGLYMRSKKHSKTT